MPKIMIPDILSLIISVFIHTVLLFVAYRAGHNDGYREGYLDSKDFEKNGAGYVPSYSAHPNGSHTRRRCR